PKNPVPARLYNGCPACEILGRGGMGPSSLASFIGRLRRLVEPRCGGLDDAELLKRFTAERDEAAFEVLLWRYGPLVLGVCRRMLWREQDVEDAFQATFLTLIRK